MAAPIRVLFLKNHFNLANVSSSFRRLKSANYPAYEVFTSHSVQYGDFQRTILRNFSYKMGVRTLFSSSPVWLNIHPDQDKSSTLGIKLDSDEHLDNSRIEQKIGQESYGKSGEEKKKDPKWTGKNAWKLGLIVLSGMGVISLGTLLYEWGSPAIDKDGNIVADEFSDLPVIQQYIKRAIKAVEMYNKIIQEPSREKLLPDPLHEPYYQPPYTLVIEMTGVLVNPEWTYGTGWRFKKRPGVEYFLQQVGYPQFEIVIYTSEQGFTAFPILDSLDPTGYIMYRLFRDATRYMKGHHVKDLDCLNRDLSKVLIIDHNPNSFQLHPRNALKLKKWKGDDADRTLIDLVEFLRATILTTGIDDVRTVLDYYGQFDEPLEAFKDNQRRIQEEKEKATKLQAELDQKKTLAGSYGGLFGRRR